MQRELNPHKVRVMHECIDIRKIPEFTRSLSYVEHSNRVMNLINILRFYVKRFIQVKESIAILMFTFIQIVRR